MLKRILVVDDEPDLVDLVCFNLTEAGYQADSALSGREAMERLERSRPDLLILDLMLPDVEGTEICRRVRAEPRLRALPVLMLTARSEEVDRIVGFEVGADDYLTKPFSFLELMARIEAVLRRCSGYGDEVETYRFGDVEVDFAKSEASKGNGTLSLSPREFKLLRFMIEHRGEVLPRERLLDAVWGYENVPFTRTVDMHIAKLRKKIEDRPQDPSFIVTVHRVGYKFTG